MSLSTMSNAAEQSRPRLGRRIGSVRSVSLAVLVGLLSIVLGIFPAAAYWNSTAAGTAASETGRLAPPTDVTVPTDAVTGVPISWSAGSGGVVPEGYYVTRHAGSTTAAACASGPTALLAATSCRDLSVPDGDYSYRVTAVFRSWTARSEPSSTVTVVNPAQLGFVSQPTEVTVGEVVAPPVVVTLLTAAGDTVATAGISVSLSIGANPGNGSLSGTTTVLTTADGTATFANLSVDRAGVGYTLVATSPGLAPATSAAFTVLPPPLLGEAGTYSVLAGAGVSNTLATNVSGDLGVAAGAAAAGFPPGTVGGDLHVGDADATEALADFRDAYVALRALLSAPTNSLAGDLAGKTIHSGVYHSTGALAVSTVVTLDGKGDTNAVFVFQVGGALNTAAASSIVLINGARAANVYWAVNGAVTVGADSHFEGSILADGAITLGANTVVIGRAFATAAVTMANNTVRFTTAPPPSLAVTGGSAVSTEETSPTVAGTTNAPSGSTVKVTIGSVTADGVTSGGQTLTATVQVGGGWSVTASPLLAGSYPIVAQVRDAAGNGTKASQTLTVQVNPAPVTLGSASSFSVLSRGGVTNTGPSHLSGDLGTSPGAVGGFPPGTLGGAIHLGDTASTAQAHLQAAIADAAGRRPHTQFDGVLGGRTFRVGVHRAPAASNLTGTVTLDGEDDPDAVFIFQSGGALTAAASCQVNLINGAKASNVFWVVNGAAGTGASCAFRGNVLAVGAITLGATTNLVGRALSREAATLDTNLITGAAPAAPAAALAEEAEVPAPPAATEAPLEPSPSGSSTPVSEPSESSSPTPSSSTTPTPSAVDPDGAP